MKALIAKELREGLKWAALILAATGIATAIGMQVCVSYWLLGCACATAVPAAAGGLLLGIMSIVFEARADRWAFLVHRAVSRTAIFFGKAAAWKLPGGSCFDFSCRAPATTMARRRTRSTRSGRMARPR
jgi:hypothetical protein